MDRLELNRAQQELRIRLEQVLGPSLPGVSGVGAGADQSGSGIGLTVLFNGVGRAAQVLEEALPDTINGLPVRVSRRGTGRLE